jgi:hypothetical protein
MLKFNQFILEGGNVKVGDVSAAPFKVTAANREERQSHIKTALTAIHASFHKETGQHLFGGNRAALSSGTAFAGSTRHLMSKEISHDEFAKHKPTVGDVDAQVPIEHKDALAKHLTAGKKFGKYTVVGTKKAGNDVSAVMKHDSGEHHQFDFEGVKYEGDHPSKGEQFSHNSHWTDTKAGIKGMHHKMLVNAAGGEKHKFSMAGGLKSRTDETDKGNKDPEHVTKTLFGKGANHEDVHSFHGVTQLIKKHIPKEQHQAIYDKFVSSVGSKKKMDSAEHEPALAHLRKHLDVKDTVSEAAGSEEHHTSVIPMVGFSPISHMGHSHDLGAALSKLPGTKHVGMSKKADLFSPEERGTIMKKQWAKHGDVQHHIVSSGGEMVAKAYHDLPKGGKKHLHILVGSDRAEMAHGLKKSLEAGKIKEMGEHKFDSITVHHPEDLDRKHGMSGTKMRTAAAAGDHETFAKHLGPMFNKKESLNIMNKVKSGLDSGQIKVKR